MSESKEAAAAGSESSGATIDPTAVALALAGADRDEANAFLRDQRSLIGAQLHHLHEQLKQIHLDIFEKWLGVALRLATLCVGLGAATAICLMVWDAAHSRGLLIEPFSVPPDMAQKGLTGQAIASQVLDRLTDMEAGSQSTRAARSYSNNWGNDIKVEIPETGVSIGEFRRFLRDWLGHDTHISGEVWHSDQGLAISARTGGERGATFSGAQSDLEALVEKAAEHVYAQTQPYRYAAYIRSAQRRIEDARAAFQRLTVGGTREDQAWAWQGLATLPGPSGSSDRYSAQMLRKAIAVYPDYYVGHATLSGAESNMSHAEEALAQAKIAADLINRGAVPDVDQTYLGGARAAASRSVLQQTGDFIGATALARAALQEPDRAGLHESMSQYIVVALGQLHDGNAAREAFRQLPSSTTLLPALGRRPIVRLRMEAAAENWNAVLSLAPSTIVTIEDVAKTLVVGPSFDRRDLLETQVYPWIALAKAKLGDIASAEATIAPTPGDCYDCIRLRGLIASEARAWGRADYWFAKGTHDAPSIPFAYEDWGRSLLARGQLDAAVEQFKRSNARGPHFADPLEGWGEALMAKNQSHLALGKFAEAEKYAPNWGRLHLKWGEALMWAGKKDEAAAQFARAAALGLTPSEKTELTSLRHV